jgi:GNAT superfamily N-acetyltransferase
MSATCRPILTATADAPATISMGGAAGLSFSVVQKKESGAFEEIARLVNAAYQGGSSPHVGWTHLQGLVEGPRTTADDVALQLASEQPAVILCLRAGPGALLGCVLLRRYSGHCYLGMLSVDPAAQARGMGRALLERSEEWARAWGCPRIAMTVLHMRKALIEWYVRRGYRPTGETVPYPYGGEISGRPLRGDLGFVVLEKRLAAAASGKG